MKNKFKLGLVTLTTIIIGIYSCKEDITEINLGGKYVTVIAPSNWIKSPYFTQRFVWEEMDGADRYQLQIASPNFDTVQQFILDTTITATQFSYTLEPGRYQWRLRAKNASSMSGYNYRYITIDSALNLSGSKVNLTSPEDNFSTNTLKQTFTWQTMPTATAYVFQILSSEGSLIATESYNKTNTEYTFSAPGTYKWRVFAQNEYSNSAYATRTINIDSKVPNTPVLLLPLADSSSKNPVVLTWTRDTSAEMDSVLIYEDVNLTQLIEATLTSSQTYNFTGTVNEDYFWRVRSKDAAGNWSAYSAKRKFVVIP